MADTVTIDQALDAFLGDQRARLSDRTYRNYEDVIRLLRDSLNTYAYSSLDARDSKRWQKASDAGDEEAFCHLFRPQEIPPHLGEFLGYVVVRKAIAGQELLKAAGTVTGTTSAGGCGTSSRSPTICAANRDSRPCPSG